jgi:hypothetical protein
LALFITFANTSGLLWRYDQCTAASSGVPSKSTNSIICARNHRSIFVSS